MIRRLLPGPIAILMILVLLTFWLDQTIQHPRIREDYDLNHQPDYIIENLSGVEVAHDKARQLLFSADVLTHYPVGDMTDFEQVDFSRIQPDKPLVRISADYAEFAGGKDNIYLKENVIIIREKDADKVTMQTEFLHLIPDAEIAKTDQPVTITRMDNTVVNAVGMELNDRTERIDLKSRVKARMDKRHQSADRPSNKK
ncbi:LPS export ABC transporter periplasmic protein LptC [Nitrosomonas sp. Is37]|uniref:LPS export ABC transporter periplasmic protein LptC n=1 Tax=Nitrosomonas sp. Is37 TaxID=3080535 RepID=UPI00294AC02B|nr:LPS export ABC transporter periplasmic protein LptC [Nitrosomonas sp. Is37]MDV6343889.1 LPS export ABC transporter periplasmic protein LptC [Nitrosomonas sp. Is37]